MCFLRGGVFIMMGSGLQALKINENKRFLEKEDGEPFFWLGDTAWELFHRLNKDEAEIYLKNRSELGFNVVQVVALSEDEGLTSPNAYGKLPLLMNDKGNYDPEKPDLSEDYSYWDHMDYIISLAEHYGIYIALLPTWGDKYNLKWGKCPVIFNKENARKYGEWIGERYKKFINIIWIMGGDRSLDTFEHFNIIIEMAKGIKKADNGKHLMTFHPQGGCSSSNQVHNEEWMDFNMIQSGHMSLNLKNYELITVDYEKKFIKPTIDGEPRYEDHPINFNPVNGYFDAVDVRQAAYWSVFAGAFGHTYGHHSIWLMCTKPKDYFIMDWRQAITRPGGCQMKHLKKLMESRSFFDRVPDQELIAENYEGANHIQATRGSDYAFIYSPNGLAIKINMGRISGDNVKASWYDPRRGKYKSIGQYDNSGVLEFIPPSSGRGEDWVLVLDNEESN